MITKLNNINATIYRINPENFHMEFYMKLTGVTVNNLKDQIKKLIRTDGFVIFDETIMVKNPTIIYAIDIDPEVAPYVFKKLTGLRI